MTTQGPNSPASGANNSSVGSTVWTNPGNITAADGAEATSSGTAEYLLATDFGFTIPSGATIDGIVVEVKRRDTGGGGGAITDDNIRIVKGGSISTTNRSAGATWAITAAYVTFGSSSDLWGETWAYSDINASNFGFALSCHQGGPAAAAVDHIRITVYYTAGGGGGGGGGGSVTFPSGYAKAKSITVDHTKVGAADLTNFVMPVVIASDTDIGAVADSTGHNIRFFLADGTLLNYERISFSITGGAASGKWWVQIPTTSHAADTVFYIAYDNSSAADGQSVAATWSTSIWDAVYHLEENPAGTSPQMQNALGSNHGTTNGSMTSGESVTGKFGNALSLDGVDDRVDCGTSLGNYSGSGAFAVTCWINPTTLGSANHGVVARDTSTKGWMIRITTGNAARLILFSTGGDFKFSDTAALSTGTWYHIAGVWSGSAPTTYKNGALDSSTGTGGTLTSITQSATLYLGYDSSLAAYFNCLLDEVRLYNVAPTADWISLEYNSVNSSVLTLGSEITPASKTPYTPFPGMQRAVLAL